MFTRARIKLTVWYLCIIMLISIAFSMVIYRALTFELERFSRMQKNRLERRLNEGFFPNPPLILPLIQDIELVDETKNRLAYTLLIINGAIFIFSGSFGFLLAGRTLRPIKEMVDDQHRFISDASHELRTPITALKTSLEVYLRDKQLTLKDAKEVLTESLGEVNHLQALTDQLLTLSKYQEKGIRLTLDQTTIDTVIQHSLQIVEPLAAQKQITLVKTGSNHTIYADEKSLVTTCTILLDNAIKYSHPNSSINVQTKKKKQHVEMKIIDTGRGISPDDLPYVFDRFYRADKIRNRSSEQGYGLGLAIAKRIIELHHGSINIESTLHKGTTIIISLPITAK